MNDFSLHDLNRKRKAAFYKDESQETFLLEINRVLQQNEAEKYQDFEEVFPTVFVVGLPRSGTTLMTQLLARGLDIGYINNFTARFWLAPVTGIKLSNIIYGNKTDISFSSKYAATPGVSDVHEFGYFWRYWLKKDNIGQILKSKEIENEIEWDKLRRTILNMHQAFGKGWMCKNIYGSYHIARMQWLLKKSIFVYIERDPLDVAISIHDARKKFFEDTSLWWSTIPLEYEELRKKPAVEQIAGQVQHLRAFYKKEFENTDQDRYIRVHYDDVCKDPLTLLKTIQQKIAHFSGPGCGLREDALDQIPEKVHFKTYDDREEEKEIFREKFKLFS